MNDSNPYKSPDATVYQPNDKTSRATSIRKEAWRGAKFAAKPTAIVFGILMGVGWLFLFGFGIFRWLSTGVSPLVQLGGILELLKGIAGSIFGIAYVSFCAAIVGAIVMGIAAFFRKFREPPLTRRRDENRMGEPAAIPSRCQQAESRLGFSEK